MRIKFLITYLLIGGFKISAQLNNDFLLYTPFSNSVSVNASYEVNSNCITNDFVKRFYLGQYLDSTVKKRVADRMLGYNTIGGITNLNLTAFFGKDSSDYSFMLSIKQQQYFNAYFGKDIFNTAFYGNSSYKGETANLGNSVINNYSFQELKFGVIWHEVDTTEAILGIAVSYLKGENFFRLRTNTSSLYTSPDASLLVLSTNANLSIADTTKTSLLDFNGNGLSAEAFAETPYKSRLGNSSFFLSVSNLGFIRWNKKTLNYKVDSTFTFSGYEIDDVFDIQDTVLNSINSDTILSNITEVNRNITSTNLPTTLLIIHRIKFSKLFELTNGLRHLFNGNYKPYLFAEGNFRINRNFATTLHVGYGGYGKLSTGVGIRLNAGKHLNFQIGSNNIQGLIIPNTLGQGAYFIMTYRFK